MKSRGYGAALAGFAFSVAACGGPTGQATGRECLQGWWLGTSAACGTYYCGPGADAPTQCRSADCQEVKFSGLFPDGGGVSGVYAYSPTAKQLSAPQRTPIAWGLTVDGGVYLAGDARAASAFSCDAQQFAWGDQVKVTYSRPQASIVGALDQAAAKQWTDVPVP